MKNILALIGGGPSDDMVFETAFGAGLLFDAHIECLHIRISSGEAAVHTPHISYAIGRGLRSALSHLKKQAAARSQAGSEHFRETCARRSVTVGGRPGATDGPSASWREEDGDGLAPIVRHARFHDLVVASRPGGPNGMPQDLIDELLVACGRPILVPAPVARPAFDMIMVCWKDVPEAARALGAAMPFLRKAKRVVAVGVAENEMPAEPSLMELRESLAWHGIKAEVQLLPISDRSAEAVAEAIDYASAQYDADLIVMGAYGRSRTRELILGGCTQHFIMRSARPVLFTHRAARATDWSHVIFEIHGPFQSFQRSTPPTFCKQFQ